MPIAAALSPMTSSITSAWSQGKGAQVNTTSQLFCAAVGAGAAMGLYPVEVTTVPLVPAGISPASSLMTGALSIGKGAQISTTSQQMAQAISIIAPMCPPAGLSILGSQIQAAMSQGKGAQVNTVVQQITSAIITYYQTGGTL